MIQNDESYQIFGEDYGDCEQKTESRVGLVLYPDQCSASMNEILVDAYSLSPPP